MNLQMEINKLNERLDAITLDTQLLIDELKEVMENEFPQEDDDYWFIDAEGRVNFTEYGINDYDIDDERLSIGNVFETEEEAELRKYSRPFKEDENNFFIQTNSSHNNIVIDADDYSQIQGVIYFESQEIAQQAIQSVGEERVKKYIFGVED